MLNSDNQISGLQDTEAEVSKSMEKRFMKINPR